MSSCTLTQEPLACQASVSLWFRYKERPIFGFRLSSSFSFTRPIFLAVILCGRGGEPWRTGGRGTEGREAGEKFKKASFRYLLLLTSSQGNEPNNVSWLPFNVFWGLKQCEYCSTVSRTFVQDCSFTEFGGELLLIISLTRKVKKRKFVLGIKKKLKQHDFLWNWKPSKSLTS